MEDHVSAGETAERGMGRVVTSPDVVALEYLQTHVGDLSQDVQVNRPPRPDSGVGAIIVVRGGERQRHGEGWQPVGQSTAEYPKANRDEVL